jgi:general secretion pathway protein E
VGKSWNTLAAPVLAAAMALGAGLFLLSWLQLVPALAPPPAAWINAAAAGAAVLLAARAWRRAALRREHPRMVAAEEALLPLDGLQTAVDRLEEAADARGAVDFLLHHAIGHEASDVHLVPYTSSCDVRFRIDGAMTPVAKLSPALVAPVTNRLKVLCGLPPYIRHRPQDGRFSRPRAGHAVDVRAAFMPTLHGERIVLRVLDRADVGRGLSTLGLTPPQQAHLSESLRQPQGLLIVTGPAGCGKTTTIYCALRTIVEQSRQERSVCTLENPVEYDLATINQTSIGESSDLTFASGLRTMLRQDPDVIMVGEIRDEETARAAVQAGLTGHLIITTVHAKRAAAAFLRLAELGIEARSVAASVSAVVAQRLLRQLCPYCRVEAPPTPGQREVFGGAVDGHSFFGPSGCRRCSMKGYAGRRGVFEVLEVDEGARALIAAGAPPEAIQRHAADKGFSSLRDNALEQAVRGETSLAEVLRVTTTETV